MAMEPLPLGFGDFSMDSISFSSLWPFQDHQPPQESMEDLKQSLAATTLQLETAREEVKKKEQSISKLAELVRQMAKERDDAREQLQQLLLAAAKPAPPPLVTSSVTDSDSLVSSPVDPFFDPVTSSDKHRTLSPPPKQCHANANAVFDMLASNKPLPQKGRLLQAVMEAGPLLQNLIVAGPLPRWRNPPPVHTLDELSLGVRAFTGAPGMSMSGGNSALLGYGGNACMKRPTAALSTPMVAMVAANCSPGFNAKRQRLQ